MSPDSKANRIALASEKTRNAEVAERILDYLARTGLSSLDFAKRIGYGHSTLKLFLSGNYHNISRSADYLVKNAILFMESHPIGESKRILGELYDTANVRLIKETFQKLMLAPAAYMIYAPPGSQKSFALEHQVAEVNRAQIADQRDGASRAFYVYARHGIRPRDLVRRIAIACGSRTANDIDQMLQNLRFEYRNRRVVLVIDETQHLSMDCLETVRELLDQPPYFSILFAGSHDLKVKFDQFSATLEQWNSRILAKVRLPGLEYGEAIGIIQREIGHLLASKSDDKSQSVMNNIIKQATVRDAFEQNRTYINVRTLTNALNQVRAGASQQQGY